MKEKVQEVLNRIRPTLQADGGNIELVDIVDGVVKVTADGCMSRVHGGSDDPENGR